MPKKNITPNSKKQVSATKKLVQQSRAQYKRDLVDKWRLLKRIGAYRSKETAAQIRLTESRIRAIEKKFKEIQNQKKLVRGRIIRPIEFLGRTTKKGKTVYGYEISPYFDFVKTKHKPTAIEGVRKVGDGYIIEKTNLGSKLRVNKKGDIVEVLGKQTRIRKRYRGRDLLAILDKLDNGTMKLKKHELFILHKWGSPHEVISAYDDGIKMIAQYVNDLKKSMDIKAFERFIIASYVEIIRVKD